MTDTMSGKTVLITGASSGIGLETARGLAAMGAHVVMVARNLARGEAAVADVRKTTGNDRIDLLLADLASLDEIRRLAAEHKAKYGRLDVLINNAGAYNSTRLLTKDGFEMTFAVNHLAYFLLTELLLDTIKASAPARIINVSSAAHVGAKINFDDLMGEQSYGGFGARAYGQSKLANVLHAYELARRIEGTGVTANALHPGVVNTRFGENNGGPLGVLFSIGHAIAKPIFISSQRGAETSVYLASSPDAEGVTGQYFVKKKAVPSNEASHDADAARRLWEISERLTGIAAPSPA